MQIEKSMDETKRIGGQRVALKEKIGQGEQ